MDNHLLSDPDRCEQPEGLREYERAIFITFSLVLT